MDEITGIPAHPLVVHVPVVVLPVLAVVAIAMAAKPDLRRRWVFGLFGSTLLTAVATFLATQSGEPLREALQPALGSSADKHAELGDQTALLAALFCVGAACLVGIDRRYLLRGAFQRSGVPAAWTERSALMVSIVTALLGVLAAVWVIRTGHEGARITWSGVDLGG